MERKEMGAQPQENGAAMPMDLPITEPGEMSVEEMAETMTDKEQKALTIMTFRMMREIQSSVRNYNEMLADIASNGPGFMAKMMGMGGLQIPSGVSNPRGGIHPNFPPAPKPRR